MGSLGLDALREMMVSCPRSYHGAVALTALCCIDLLSYDGVYGWLWSQEAGFLFVPEPCWVKRWCFVQDWRLFFHFLICLQLDTGVNLVPLNELEVLAVDSERVDMLKVLMLCSRQQCAHSLYFLKRQ